mmetsp:Transcript_33942/g.82352  ORF Transcript_33942/g.82352 Transcript_33942/m.82352 type:complete len:290 (-) Transcript_33942:721-1590(-)
MASLLQRTSTSAVSVVPPSIRHHNLTLLLWKSSARSSSSSSLHKNTPTSNDTMARLQPLSNKRRRRESRRHFQTQADFQQWRRNVRDSALLMFRPQKEVEQIRMEPLDLPTAAPFLQSVAPMADQLLLAGVKDATPSSPRDSLLECTYPLESNDILRYSVTDFSDWSAFRLGKFYELVDALTADVAYRHVASSSSGSGKEEVALVTAGHYHSRKYTRTDLNKDATLRSYVTKVGRSSLEVRTDGWQDDDRLINVCHTIMVALDPQTMKPLSRVGNRALYSTSVSRPSLL